MIKRPDHYKPKKGTIMPVHLIESMDLNHHEGNIVKYICRYKEKNGLDDLLKARWCLNRLIRQWSKKHGNRVQERKGLQTTGGTDKRNITVDTPV